MHAGMLLCMDGSMFAYVRMHVIILVCVNACTIVRMQVCMHTPNHMCLKSRMHVCMYDRIHEYMQLHMYA